MGAHLEWIDSERQQGLRQCLDAQRARCEADILQDLCVVLSHVQEQAAESVARALAKLDEGTFGYCDICHGEIAAQRLAAWPFAIRCGMCEPVDDAVPEAFNRKC